MNLRSIFLLLTFLFASTSAHAELSLDAQCLVGGSNTTVTVKANLRGMIQEDAGRRFISYLDALEKHSLVVPCSGLPKSALNVRFVLDSKGGDINAALAIAERVLSLGSQGHVYIPQDATCLSACVLLLAGAQNRAVHGSATVGIHRPYLPRATVVTRADMQTMYSNLTARLENFFVRAGVDGKLAHHMMRVSPEQIRFLTRDELAMYGLLESSAAAQESRAMEEALELGISRQELAKRMAHGQRVCGRDPCANSRGVTETCMAYVWCMRSHKRSPVPE